MSKIKGSKGMEPAIDYAEAHGFDVTITGGSHLAFSGFGQRVIGPLTAGDKRSALNVRSQLRRLVREHQDARQADKTAGDSTD